MDEYSIQKIVVFAVTDQGRRAIATFQEHNRIVSIAPGYMVNDVEAPPQQPAWGVRGGQQPPPRAPQQTEEPCLWVLYIPGRDPFLEAVNTEMDDITEPSTTEPTKPKKGRAKTSR